MFGFFLVHILYLSIFLGGIPSTNYWIIVEYIDILLVCYLMYHPLETMQVFLGSIQR